MTDKKDTPELREVGRVLIDQEDYLKGVVREVIQEVLESEMEEALCAGKWERTEGREGYRSGYYRRGLLTRVGKLELRVPQDREGRFSTEVFQRYQRSEKALVLSLVEMYIQGVSTRKVKKITEQLCGHKVSASTISQLAAKLDEHLETFSNRKLEGDYPYLILDARYEKVRESAVVGTEAVLIAIGINTDGRREVLGVELATKESKVSWKEFLVSLKQRGLIGVKLVVSDNHEGLKQAISEVFVQSLWQRCFVHFLRNASSKVLRRTDGDCIKELKLIWKQESLEKARRELKEWLSRWESKYPKLTQWVEENIEETFTFYVFPKEHRKRIRSTNMLERVNQEIKRRTRVIRIFPNRKSCLRLIRALLAETHEQWVVGKRYLDMSLLRNWKMIKSNNLDTAA